MQLSLLKAVTFQTQQCCGAAEAVTELLLGTQNPAQGSALQQCDPGCHAALRYHSGACCIRRLCSPDHREKMADPWQQAFLYLTSLQERELLRLFFFPVNLGFN